jgi:hypothetical protein
MLQENVWTSHESGLKPLESGWLLNDIWLMQHDD